MHDIREYRYGLLSADDLRQHLDDPGASDQEVYPYGAAAEAWASAFLGWETSPHLYVITADADTVTPVQLPRDAVLQDSPAGSRNEATVSGPSITPLTVWQVGDEVTYTPKAGVIPPDIKMACLLKAREIYDQRGDQPHERRTTAMLLLDRHVDRLPW